MAINLKNIVALTVPEYLIISIFSTLSAFLIISGNLENFNLLILSIISISFVVLALNALNQVYDAEIDKISKPKRPIPSNKISINEAKMIAVLLYLMALIVSLIVSTTFVYLIVVYIFISILYSAPPARLRRVPFSSNIFGSLFHAVIPFTAAWIINQNIFPVPFFIFFLVIGFIMSSTKDLEDIAGDKRWAIKNFCTVFGKQDTLKFIAFSYPLIILSMLLLSTVSIISKRYILSSIVSLILVSILLGIYNKELEKEEVITQSKIVTYGMVISILIQLSYGLASISS